MEPYLIVALAFPVAFSAIWCGTCFLIAILGGWRSLAERYRTELTPPGDAATMTYGLVGTLGRYRGVLTVGGRPEGLFLSVMVLFRPGHPALCIPWSDLSETGQGRGFLGGTVKLEVRGGGTLILPADAWAAARRAA